MSRRPYFVQQPNGEYLCTLAGCVLMAADAVYGDPAEVTPEGRARAEQLIDRFVAEATARGFVQGDALRALLRRGDRAGRVLNLLDQAADSIPKERQMQVMADGLGGDLSEQPAPGATPVTDYPASALRSGADGLDPRFLAAGHALELVREQHGDEAIHRREYADLFMELMRYAPLELRQSMRAKMQELGLMPEITHVGDNGQPIFSAEQIAETHGVPVEEVERFVAEHVDPAELYTGQTHRVQ